MTSERVRANAKVRGIRNERPGTGKVEPEDEAAGQQASPHFRLLAPGRGSCTKDSFWLGAGTPTKPAENTARGFQPGSIDVLGGSSNEAIPGVIRSRVSESCLSNLHSIWTSVNGTVNEL